MNKINLSLTSVLVSVALLAGCTANGINTKSLNDNRGYRPFGTTAPGTMPTQFTDVPGGEWYTDKVQWGANLGIIDGYPDLTFHPNSSITRAEVIKIIKSLADNGYLTVPAAPKPAPTSPAVSPVVPTTTPTSPVTSPATTSPSPVAPVATPTTLGTGTFYVGVGKDVAAGRYVVSTTDKGGNFVVLDKNGIPVVNEILGTDANNVNNITIDLVDGQKIEISSLNVVKFTPKA